ncbi:CLUMA_CG009194, isoform A [Clunio marinus]|uniref:CLUMA_CG009194, isoform A n=1 Tax=Clunio marinus TaxID=568069 RepID=A0A1J1IBC1_9DIPT|nr:CLUMA_CG009194, isoform A [Clunio marinus]
MYWDTNYSNSVNIVALLNKEKCTLKELLEDEDILAECKSQNHQLVKFLNRTEIVDELITLISTEPSLDYPEDKRFLYPNVACEIITSDVPTLKQRMVEDQNIMNKLYGFFEQEPPLNPLLASFICKTFGMLMKKMELDWFLYQTICLHVIEFIKSKDNFLEVMTQHLATPVVVDLLLNMLNDIEDDKMKIGFLEWINKKGLIAKMIGVLQIPSESNKHESVAKFLTEMIKTGRCNRQMDTEERKALPNPLLQTLEDNETVDQLLDVILSEPRTECGILSGMQVLLCLLVNPIIEEPVSQSALQQMIDAEKEHHDEIVASLMEIIKSRVHQLFELLLDPPIIARAIGSNTDYPLTPPLGNVRLQLCYLFTVLLETENGSIIEAICKTNFFIELLKLFKQYCWNNFLHNYVKKCLVYGLKAFDTIPNSTKLVISALQRHIIVECKVADKLIDCWNVNDESQKSGGRRMGYMGHLIDIFNDIHSTLSVSDDFCALIESSLTLEKEGDGELAIDMWRRILQLNEEEKKTQSRLLADCDPTVRQDDGRDGLSGFPSSNAEYENDTEDFDYQFNASMLGAVNGVDDFLDDFINDENTDARNKFFEEACIQNLSTFSMDTNFADWNNADATSANHDFPFNFESSLSLKTSSSPFEGGTSEEHANNDEETFIASSNLDSIIGNNNISNQQLFNGTSSYDQNDFLMNFYVTNTHFPLSATNNISPYNPFHYHHKIHDDTDINSNNDNWANFNSDNFADFDSHFTNMPTSNDEATKPLEEGEKSDNEDKHVSDTCFVATTQTIEISMAPPKPPIKRDFQLGTAVPASAVDFRQALEEIEDDEFFSLRDDSNEMSSLTDDNDKKLLENTEVPDDEDDDFESADESKEAIPTSESSLKPIEKYAQAPGNELISQVVSLENGTS